MSRGGWPGEVRPPEASSAESGWAVRQALPVDEALFLDPVGPAVVPYGPAVGPDRAVAPPGERQALVQRDRPGVPRIHAERDHPVLRADEDLLGRRHQPAA